MRISQGDLQYYRSVLDDIATQATDYVRDAIEQLGDGQGVTAMREAAIEALQESVSIHGEMSQGLAAQLFDEVCSMEGIGPYTFGMMDDIIDFGMLEEKVRYYARTLVDSEGNAQFLNDCGQLADFYAWRVNRDSMMRNCERNGVRYARVPTNSNACDYCVMLASRGFVYRTAKDAEAGSHAHCRCIVCPGGASTTIEGYDPDALYDQWRESGFMPSKKTGGSKSQGTSNSNRRRGRGRSAERLMSPQDKERMFDRMNAATTREKLEDRYRDAVRDLQRRGGSANDADWEDVGNHYAYLLETYYKKRRRR